MFCFNYDYKYDNKSVHFNNIVQVYLIPSIKDLMKANLIHILWWSDSDYLLFLNNKE